MTALTLTPYRPLARMQVLDPGTGKSTPLTAIVRFPEGVAPFSRGESFDFGGRKYAVLGVDSITIERRTLQGPPELEAGFALTVVPLVDRGEFPTGQ